MLGYTIKRLLQMTLVLFAVSVIVFLMMSFTGDPVFMVIPIDSTAAEIEQARRLLGLDSSLLSQYFIFLTNLLQGDFGRSYVFRQPAMDLILERLPATIEMVLVAITLATVVAVPLGVFAGANPNRPVSRGIMAGSLLGISSARLLGGHDADLLLLSAVSAPAVLGTRRDDRVSGAPPVDPDP